MAKQQLTPALPEVIAQHISTLELAIDVVQTNIPEELISLAVTDLNKSSVSTARAGFYLLNLKSLVAHGAFETAMKSHGVCRQRASEAMQVAQALMALPPSVAKKLISLPKARTIELSRIDPEYLDEIATTGELDEVVAMSRDELRDYVRSLESKNVNLSQQIEIEKAKTKSVSIKKGASIYPDFVEMARHESTALCDKVMLCADDLARLHQELDSINNLQASPEASFTKFMQVAQASLFHNLRAASARINALLNQLQNEFDEAVTGPVDATTFFTDDEIRIALSERAHLVSEHQHEGVLREDARVEKKLRRGRKAKQ